MDVFYNVSSVQVWQATMDMLDEHIRSARDMPEWAIAVVVLCAIVLCVAIGAFVFGCALFAFYSVSGKRRQRDALLSDVLMSAAAEEPAEESVETMSEKKRRKKPVKPVEMDEL